MNPLPVQGIFEMPRGSGAHSAEKCPHFDISKPTQLELFINCYKNVKLKNLIEGLKPAAKTQLASKLGIKVKLE